jgi:hypothetical protein
METGRWVKSTHVTAPHDPTGRPDAVGTGIPQSAGEPSKRTGGQLPHLLRRLAVDREFRPDRRQTVPSATDDFLNAAVGVDARRDARQSGRDGSEVAGVDTASEKLALPLKNRQKSYPGQGVNTLKNKANIDGSEKTTRRAAHFDDHRLAAIAAAWPTLPEDAKDELARIAATAAAEAVRG